MKRGLGSESRLVAAHAVGPCGGEFGFESSQTQVADQQAEVFKDYLYVRVVDVTETAKNRGDRSQDTFRMISIGPQLLESVVAQEHGAQVCLRVEIRGDHRNTEVGVHPGEVVDQGRFADPSLVVEESDGFHGFLRMVASTLAGSKVNSASGFPFFSRASCARMTPRPKWLT